MMTRHPELTVTARTLATLALERGRQDGTLRVRQGEQLRRALTTAGTALRWDLIPGSREDRVAVATKDVAQLADAGAELLESDLVTQVTGKKGEVVQIKKVAKSVHKLAGDKAVAYPTEVEYSHTVRNGLGGLVTKTAKLVLNDAAEALSAAETIERKLVNLEKLRDQMLLDLKDKQRQVKLMRQGLSSFVQSSNGLLTELLGSSS